jgi:hypothetical protein
VKSSQVFFEACMVVAIFNPSVSDVLMLKRERKIKVKIKQMIPM